jgi:hypothetical protein
MLVLARLRALFLPILVGVIITACGVGGFSRGVFQGNVMGKTIDEIVAQFGKPASQDMSQPDAPKIVYLKKTFDPDNGNKEDAKTIISFRKEGSKIVAFDLDFE